MSRPMLLALLCLGAACDSGGAEDASAPAADARASNDGGVVHVVPDPGNDPMPQFWPETEPNDTPEQAVPLGIGSGQIGPYIGAGGRGGHLGGADPADYFVFRTGHATGSSFISVVCWDATLNINLADIVLYKVVDGQPLMPLYASSSTDTTCERFNAFNLPLDPDTKYLFAILHVEGEADYTA